MMRRALFMASLLGLLASCGGHKDNSVDVSACRNELTANKIYRTEVWLETSGSVTPGAGDSSTAGEHPMLTGTSHSVVNIETGVDTVEGRLPVVVRLELSENVRSINGVHLPGAIPDTLDGTVEMNGYYSDHEIHLDSTDATVIQEWRALTGTVLSSLTKSIEFPDQPMKIGESFSRSEPMDIPLHLNSEASVVITYTLKDFDDRTAQFSVEAAMSMADSSDLARSDFSLNGSGDVVYDLRTGNVKSKEMAMDALLPAAFTGMGMGMAVRISERLHVDVFDAE